MKLNKFKAKEEKWRKHLVSEHLNPRWKPDPHNVMDGPQQFVPKGGWKKYMGTLKPQPMDAETATALLLGTRLDKPRQK